MNYDIFITEWIKRSERRKNKDLIDMADKFISLWIAFNAWLKNKFGETKTDRELINEIINFKKMEDVFENLKTENNEFQQLSLTLQNYSIINMRYPEDESKKKCYDGSFELLMESLYAIRCNLFHGRKNFDDNEEDEKLVCLAYKILLPLFKKYLENNEPHLYNF